MNLDDFIRQIEKTKSFTDGFDFCFGEKLGLESLSNFEKKNEIYGIIIWSSFHGKLFKSSKRD